MNLVVNNHNVFLIVFVTFLVSVLLVPIVKKVAEHVGAMDVPNARKVHKKPMPRLGGLAIYIAFLFGYILYGQISTQMISILIGSFLLIIVGIFDDINSVPAKYKFLVQTIAASIVVVYGKLGFSELTILGLSFHFPMIINDILAIFFIVAITNAINLIDGLDGLSSGISIIVLCVIGFIAYQMRRIDAAIVALIMVGSIAGVLPYNFHPASIFVGDCGALFMGYMIACLSLLGFKSTAFVSLVFPLIILFVPLADTSLAIIRRKLKGQKISEADRSHLHHVLMYKIGLSHRNTVLLLYLVSFLFGCDAIIMYFHQTAGLIMLFILCCIAWMFIELTGMINPKFHPVIGFLRRTIGHPKKSDDAFFEANKIHHSN